MGTQINTRSLESLNVTERRDWEGKDGFLTPACLSGIDIRVVLVQLEPKPITLIDINHLIK